MKNNCSVRFIILLLIGWGGQLNAQEEQIEMLPYGDMDNWMVREIKESYIIGNETRYIYEVTDEQDTLKGNTPYENKKSPWATSSVYAKVKGIKKASVSVFPEKRNKGYAARLENKVEHVKVLGVLEINVLASGTLFLGQIVEPIENTDNPNAKLLKGVPFDKKPDYLQYDYKVITGGPQRKIHGLRKKGKKIGENDQAEVYIILQKRWEDKDGNIYAKRIGTGSERFDETDRKWHNEHRLTVHYGDISEKSFFNEEMSLNQDKENSQMYARNSAGKVVPVIEKEWGTKDDKVTHLMVQFTTGNGGAYIGNPESRLWVDNVNLVYKEEQSKQ